MNWLMEGKVYPSFLCNHTNNRCCDSLNRCRKIKVVPKVLIPELSMGAKNMYLSQIHSLTVRIHRYIFIVKKLFFFVFLANNLVSA